jgi:hypothetical protein
MLMRIEGGTGWGNKMYVVTQFYTSPPYFTSVFLGLVTQPAKKKM